MCVCEWISYTITGAVKEFTKSHSFSGSLICLCVYLSSCCQHIFQKSTNSLLFRASSSNGLVPDPTDFSGVYHMHSTESDIQYENETVCIVQAMWCVTSDCLV